MKKYEIGTPHAAHKYRIKITADGPYLVYGNPPIIQEFIEPNAEGNSWSYRQGEHNYTDPGSKPTALCRCGYTKNPPYCDGSHLSAPWDPQLTASHRPLLEEVDVTQGADLLLTDNESYCAFARFCDAKGRTWNQVEESDDPQKRALAIRTANSCPAGRLKVWDKTTGKPYELETSPSLALLEDPAIECSAGIWVRGGIPITTEDGYTFEVRNRVTLCRCGESRNKPFCDGTHAPAKFHDHLPKK